MVTVVGGGEILAARNSTGGAPIAGTVGSAGGGGRSGSSIGRSGPAGKLAAASAIMTESLGAPSGSAASMAAGYWVAAIKSSLRFL